MVCLSFFSMCVNVCVCACLHVHACMGGEEGSITKSKMKSKSHFKH